MLTSKMGLYHVVPTTPKTSPEKTYTVVDCSLNASNARH